MAKKDKSKSGKKKFEVGSDTFWMLCKAVREGRLAKTKLEGDIEDAQGQVCAVMLSDEGRKLGRKLESDEVGLKVTVTQSETDVWDGDGVWSVLDRRTRPLAFDRRYDFSVLSSERQAELHQMMIDALSPAEKRVCVKHTLNVDRMSQAVQDDRIDPAIIAPFMTTKKSAPYITVTPHGA